ncbi:hypothetical protein RUM44_003444 [Polyplax serrata]|uniref:Uncharacterized protein n=1 Tax=Polyplax serrata TaxID=468196 RepID=A0ABR1AGH6_POLSC
MKISVRDWVPESNVKMLRRKSLSLDKSPVNKSERGDRRSSVAAGLLGYKERSPVHLFLDKSSPTEKSVKNERRGSFGGTTPEVKERRGSIVQRYDDVVNVVYPRPTVCRTALSSLSMEEDIKAT